MTVHVEAAAYRWLLMSHNVVMSTNFTDNKNALYSIKAVVSEMYVRG